MDLELIHVHGFGETDPGKETEFTKRYKQHLPVLLKDSEIKEFKWNTLPCDPTVLVNNFIKSEERTHDAASLLAQKIKNSHHPIWLSGFSLGGAMPIAKQ